MKILVLGASGATGKLVLKRLLDKRIETKIIVRDPVKIPDIHRKNRFLECITGNITGLEHDEFLSLVSGCDGVISCLGHNITLKGVFGEPKMLVTDTLKKISEAIVTNGQERTKFVLMNTTANRNSGIGEKYGLPDRVVLSLLYRFLPPQRDNVEAASFLVSEVGSDNSQIEWVVVRPDTLVDDENESEYEIHKSPIQSPVFKAGKTSRINVSSFMVSLLFDEKLWERWKFQMPVIYNKN